MRISPMKGALISPSKDPQVRDPADDENLDEEEGQEDLDPEIEMQDLFVKSASYKVGIANQSLKNALNVRAHLNQAKERVVGRGNNLLGSRYVPGRGGFPNRGRLGGRGGRFVDNRQS
ncbi:hypothetical protein U1Q18_042281 [Sarracenia purpurea var. burkii]